MIYVKNFPISEQATRLVAACAMAACSFYLWGSATGWVLLGLAAVTLLTGLVGFCPGCALVGRNPVGGRGQA